MGYYEEYELVEDEEDEFKEGNINVGDEVYDIVCGVGVVVKLDWYCQMGGGY